jgi:deoxyuridine 5'-triphosphate nucleotidohydrolase
MEFPLPYYSESGYKLFYGHDGDAGLDLPIWDERFPQEITFQPMEAITLKTGIHMKIPVGNYGFLDTRSSTSKIKLDLLCRTIDEPYTGNIRLALINLNQEPVTIKQGQCVAQIIIKEYTKVAPQKHDSLEDFLASVGETTRGDKGFGSTGRNV